MKQQPDSSVTPAPSAENLPSSRIGVRAQPPLESAPPAIAKPATSAGGIDAVVSAVKNGLGEMGATRTLKTLAVVNQVDGFDCPGCAWPEPDERSRVEFCENGAKAVAEEATLKRVTPEFFKQNSVQELSDQSDHWLGKQGRLTHAMVLRPGASHYEPIEWDDAFALIAAELKALPSPDHAVFYTSGRTSNEAAFLYQLFVRRFGTNNLPDCSNMCHESSGTAMNEAIGVGKGTVSLSDFDKADTILVIGQNPGTNHPRMLTALQSAARRGCKIVSINPLPEAGLIRFKHPQEVSGILGSGTPLACLFLQVRINGDVALLKGIMKEMLDEEARHPGTVLDQAFIDTYTDGFDAFRAALADVDWDDIVEQSGISREQIREAAEIAMSAENLICCWAMGLTQHKNAVANIQEVVNFLLLRGWIGKPGSGACPVRGHSNVQGDRTMGIYEKPSPAFLDSLAREFGFDPPRNHGYDTVDAIKAMHDGNVGVFFALGGNFLSATPDTEFTADALRRCKLTVHVSTKLNRSHLIAGETALILPCLGRTEIDAQASGEQFVTVEDSMSMVHMSKGKLPPASAHLLSEPQIVARLANAVLGPALTPSPSPEPARSSLVRGEMRIQGYEHGTQGSVIDWLALAADYDRIREHISRVVAGFEEFNARVRQPGGFQLPNSARNRDFRTSTGKARFTVHPLPRIDLADGEYLMMTIRSHDQYNTTIYGLDDRYRGIHNGRRVVLMNAGDIESAGFKPGAWVDLTCAQAGRVRTAERFVVVPYDIPRRCVATYFPEANAIVPVEIAADKSNTPASKSVIITITSSTD